MVTICEHCGKYISHKKKKKGNVINLFECPYCMGNIGSSYRLRVSEEEFVQSNLYIEEYMDDSSRIRNGNPYTVEEMLSFLR